MEGVRITYHGHSMFEIMSAAGVKIATDPYNEQIKSRLPEVSADIVFVSHDHFDHSNVSIISGDPVVLDTPAQSVEKGIEFEGILTHHDTNQGELRGQNIIFKFKVDSITFAHMGDLGHVPGEELFIKLEDVDILMLPVGGTYTIDANTAVDIIKRIKPAVAIPMHYKETDSKLQVDTVDRFLSDFSAYIKKGHSVLVAKDGLPENTEIWLMQSA